MGGQLMSNIEHRLRIREIDDPMRAQNVASETHQARRVNDILSADIVYDDSDNLREARLGINRTYRQLKHQWLHDKWIFVGWFGLW